MKITSSGIVNGYFRDEYGKHSAVYPPISIPFTIVNAPNETVCFALVFDDDDAIPVCGRTFIHWTATDFTRTDFSDDASRKDKTLLQGASSLADDGAVSQIAASVYCGMAPPDKDHEYELRVYALNKKTNLAPGFSVAELYAAIKGHVIATAKLRAMYRK